MNMKATKTDTPHTEEINTQKRSFSEELKIIQDKSFQLMRDISKYTKIHRII